jgi:hypothetical protein
MATEKPLKSAVELAMDKLRERDRDSGDAEHKPLTPAQKKRIAQLRQNAKAKLAEIEILHRGKLAGAAGDPAELEKIEERYGIDRRRVESRLESDLGRARRGEDPAEE